MRKNITKVIEAFQKHIPATGGTCWTDGQAIYSYQMIIAWRGFRDKVLIVPYQDGPSQTTRSHIHACQTLL